jgi:hypothetical protein
MEDDKFKPAYLSAYQYKFNHYKLLDLNQFIELVEHLNRSNKKKKIVLSNPRFTKKVSAMSKNQFNKINSIVDILDGQIMSNLNSIEPMFVRRCDAMHLKKTVQARDYLRNYKRNYLQNRSVNSFFGAVRIEKAKYGDLRRPGQFLQKLASRDRRGSSASVNFRKRTSMGIRGPVL